MKRWSGLVLIFTLLAPFSAVAKGGFVKSPEKSITIYGFAEKQDDLAVISSGTKKYTLPWRKFIRLNNFKADHARVQSKYVLPNDNDLRIETQAAHLEVR